MLAYKPTDAQSPQNETGPINPPEAAGDLSPEQTRKTIRKAGTLPGDTVQEVTDAVRCEPETLTSNAEVGRRIDSAAGQRMSSISKGIPLEDLGLSSDSSDDEGSYS